MFYIWSDSCASQFRSRFVFALMTHFNLDYTIQWYYNERHHGKGPMEGAGIAVKNMIFQHVKSKRCVINGAKDFAEYGNKMINGISCLYLAENEIMAKPQDIKTSSKIPRTLKFLKFYELIMKIMFVKWSFTSLLTKQTRFTFSGTAKRANVCGHNQLPLSYEIDQTCGYCKERHNGNEEWLKYKFCYQWFHKACFEK